MTETFVMRLSKCALTVKNISSYESDMLDDDDYYGYHGGLYQRSNDGLGKGAYGPKRAKLPPTPERIDTKTIQEETAEIHPCPRLQPQMDRGTQGARLSRGAGIFRHAGHRLRLGRHGGGG